MHPFQARSASRQSAQAGLTLIEILVVVAIITLLGAMAVPRYTKYQANAATTEAYVHLSHGWVLQNSYFLDHGEFAAASDADLGWKPPAGNDPRYVYDQAESPTDSTFRLRATATAGLGSCQNGSHVIIVDEEKIFRNSAGTSMAKVPIPGC